MFARLVLFAGLLVASVSLAVPRRAYVVAWGREGAESEEQRALIDQVDRRLRNCGEGTGSQTVVLKPSLEIFPRALKLNVVVMRSADRKFLGSISTKAAGSSRDAQLRAIVTRVCHEADQLE